MPPIRHIHHHSNHGGVVAVAAVLHVRTVRSGGGGSGGTTVQGRLEVSRRCRGRRPGTWRRRVRYR